MSDTTLIEGFLLLQVFVMGALAAIAIRQAYVRHENEREAEHIHPQVNFQIPAGLKESLIKEAETDFKAAMKNSTAQLQDDLNLSSKQVNELLMRLATEVVNSELANYRKDLAELHKQSMADMASVKSGITAHKAEMEAKVAQEVQAEKLRLVKQIDTKLADAVGSFLTETLQHNVDLGSQTEYLTSMLEEHKADFVKEVGSEDGPAK